MDENQNTKVQPQILNHGLGRPPGKELLKQRILQLLGKANALEVLHKMLPEVPTPEQDQAIFNIACGVRID